MQRTLILAALLLAAEIKAQDKIDHFVFDTPDETVKAALLDNPLFYDAGIAPSSNGLWIAWLEFVPGKGDQLWLGLRNGESWVSKKLISEKPGDFANPTPTIDSLGRLWLSYETMTATNWSIVVRQDRDSETLSSTFAGINHRVASAPNGTVSIVYQEDVGGQFRVRGLRISHDEAAKKWTSSSLKDFAAPVNAWRPCVTVSPNNSVHFVCDSYDGTSYNVFAQTIAEGAMSITPLAASPGFEARAQIASDKNGKLFVAWEEDGENWGKHYLARTPGAVNKKSTRMADNEGPLHRFRRLHFAELNEAKGELKEYELPQPAFELANKRTNTPAGLKNFGTFYENAQLVVDGQNRPWIVYRHSYVPWIGLVPETHKQDNMRIYARCLLPGGWSKLFAFSEGQGDGMQRVCVAPLNDGISVAYTIGRTDRRKGEKRENKRGVALAEIHLAKSEVKTVASVNNRKIDRASQYATPQARQRPTTQVADKKYELFFGDLHRHTDISLCFSPADGNIEDAYRYAIDAGSLDFLGITDHTHDLDMGEPLSLIWHRARKEVNRHALAGKFVPFYSYERSRGDTDHNVISLRDDVLRPHTYALSQFWSEMDTNTFTIPHQPFNSVTWKYEDDVHRPLLEIYQGFRNDAKEEDAKQGLARGHHIGFIAASDHMSTGASYAAVWAEKADREILFRAMQARRTYAATAKIVLKVTCGQHWMGERFELEKMKAITVKVTPTAKISALELFINGESKVSAADQLQAAPGSETTWEVPSDQSLAGTNIFYVRVTQEDGNRAWSSPMWIDIKKKRD